MRFTTLLTLILVICLSVFSVSEGATRRPTLGYWGTSNVPRSFGPWVLNCPGWNDYVIYVSQNSRVHNGAPSGTQGNEYYNTACSTPWADRIWMYISHDATPYTWSLVGLALPQGGPGESALIGDPSVVYWAGKFHMYYEGTDQCGGYNNCIFHAWANDWMGPWTKTGEVVGLHGNTSGSGLSWPTTFVEDNGGLYLIYSDGNVLLQMSRCTNSNGTVFTPDNSYTILGAYSNRATLIKEDGTYWLVFDTDWRTKIKYVSSPYRNYFDYTNAVEIMGLRSNGWENVNVGLPMWLRDNDGDLRIFYTGEGTSDWGEIGEYIFD